MFLEKLILKHKKELDSIGIYNDIVCSLNDAFDLGRSDKRKTKNFEISQELLNEYFIYNDGFLYWKKSTANRNKFIGCIAGTQCKKTKYRFIRIGGKQYLLHRMIFLYHHGYLPEVVDHKDKNNENNRIDNLRMATHQKNACNRTAKINGTSKYLGVYKGKNNLSKPYEVSIRTNGKKKLVGYFKTEKEAALAYNEEAKITHKEFASLNVID